MQYIILLTIFFATPALAYDVYLYELELLGDLNDGQGGWAGYYRVNPGRNPVQEVPIPNCYPSCTVGVGPYLPSGADRGIIGRYNIVNGVRVMGGTWNDGFSKYLLAHPKGASVRTGIIPIPDIGVRVNVSDLCFNMIAVSSYGSISTPPGTTCSHARPAPASCNVFLPSTLDLGTVSVGSSGSRGAVNGSASCTNDVSLRVKITNSPNIDGRPVQVSVNGHELTSSYTPVGRGKSISLHLTALIKQPLEHAGTYTTDSVITFSYD